MRGPSFGALLAGGLLALLPLNSGSITSAVDLLRYVPISAHQAYGYELALTSFKRNPAARDWLGAAEKALLSPNPVALPYRAGGRLGAESETALGVGFEAKARVSGDTGRGSETWDVSVVAGALAGS